MEIQELDEMLVIKNLDEETTFEILKGVKGMQIEIRYADSKTMWMNIDIQSVYKLKEFIDKYFKTEELNDES
jgi:hypothetical protein